MKNLSVVVSRQAGICADHALDSRLRGSDAVEAGVM